MDGFAERYNDKKVIATLLDNGQVAGILSLLPMILSTCPA